MDGVLLAGGLASRLGPITKVTNKHLLPIYDKPLIFYGIETLRDLGCERIIIILGGNSVGDIVNLVRDGSNFGVEVIYKYQSEPLGISHAIYSTRDIIDIAPFDLWAGKFLVLLGDNIFSNGTSLKDAVDEWYWAGEEGYYATFVYSSDHPHDYGQPILTDEGTKIERFVEKDTSVDHNLIVTGLYGLDTKFFRDFVEQGRSARGEFEITDSLSARLPDVYMYNYDGFWSDCGTPEGLAQATQYMMKKGEQDAKNGSGRKESASNLPRVQLSS